MKEWGLFQLNQKLMREVGTQIISGPFKGMTLTPMTYEEHIGPYLLGTYEMELHPWWEHVFLQSFGQIIDVGAKFGYYAVGLAHRFPHAPIVAFDTDWWARDAVREMVAANRAAGVSVQGFCSPAWLKKNLHENALIISDCEGYERELFCTTEIPTLTSATMIIETHENFVPGVLADIVTQFARTHIVHEVSSRSNSPIPEVRVHSLTEDEMRRASNEVRPHQTYVFLVPRPA
ncbi:MAG TPA: hypothetical protein VGV06_10500 [Methylomirabilota bacterium]|nr:hypothetical protein [Methylomirabilota bacterium]